MKCLLNNGSWGLKMGTGRSKLLYNRGSIYHYRIQITNIMLVVLLIITFLLCPTLLRAQGIRVCGPVKNVLFPGKKVEDITIIVEVFDATPEAAYKRNWYAKLLPCRYVERKISVKLADENYAQLEPIEFIPIGVGRYEHTLRIKHKANIAEENLSKAEQCIQEGAHDMAMRLINEVIESRPQPRAYIMKVQLIGEMWRSDAPMSAILLNFGDYVKHDEQFQRFPAKFRYNFYLQFGTALIRPRGLSENKLIDVTATNYDFVVRAFSEAIALRSDGSRAYQGKYLIQSMAGFNSDMISTIKEFFKRNSDVTSERVVKHFLADWVTGIEKLTGYPRKTEGEYLESIRREMKYKAEWDNLFAILNKYEHLYREGGTPLDERLRKARSLAEKIFGAKQ